VNGFIAALKSSNSIGQVINLGSNFEISVGDLADNIARLMGEEIEIQSEDQRLRPDKSEVERLWADNNKAKQLLGWQPDYGGLDGLQRGLSETIAWYQSNLSLYKTELYNI